MDTTSRTSICESFRHAITNDASTILSAENQKDPVLEFAKSTARGLSTYPKRLECRFLYDKQGSDLFERITEQPEYYLTRTETALLEAHAEEIREITGRVTIAELGSGSSVKTRLLLRAWLAHGGGVRYVPVDVSHSALSGACQLIGSSFGTVRVIAINSDYRGAFPLLKELSPSVVLFLGSSIGNFSPSETSWFIGNLVSSLSGGDFLLLGLDLAKEREIIEPAYNDAAGITAKFTRNIFARMNRELGSTIRLDELEHVARYLPDVEEVEIEARFTAPQTIRVEQLNRSFPILRGETVEVERCRKYRLERFVPYLESFGLSCERIFTDPRKWFALLLLRLNKTVEATS